MEFNDIERLLTQMREASVTARRLAITARDIFGLQKAQADIDIIDRALADELALEKVRVDEEFARQRREVAERERDSLWVPIELDGE